MPKVNTTKILDFEVIDHGYNHSQYFQGCGTAFTDFNHVATGAGSNQKEAYSDALEQIASSLHAGAGDLDLTRLDRHGNANYFRTRIPAETSKAMNQDNNETYYYLSIRYNLPEAIEKANNAAMEAFRAKHNAAS